MVVLNAVFTLDEYDSSKNKLEIIMNYELVMVNCQVARMKCEG